jgi:hypothetical protein
VILLHLDTGKVIRLDPTIDKDLCYLETSNIQRKIRRVALLDDNRRRVDLPFNRNGIFRMWIERVEDHGEVKGERFCMRSMHLLMQTTLYYSDNRVVIDLDVKGGFR